MGVAYPGHVGKASGNIHRLDGMTMREGDTVASDADSVDQYISSCDASVRPVLEEIRVAVRDAVPRSGEKIAYGIPTVTLDGKNLLSYAAWTSHLGVYPIPAGDEAFAASIAPYRDAKSTARFPLADPIPVDLIATMARLLAAQRVA